MMNREKQIEKMRKEVARIHRFFLEADDYEDLDEYIADMLYNAGYRKQVAGEWIRDTASKFYLRYNCTACNHRLLGEPTNYCPNCGAKMKGE